MFEGLSSTRPAPLPRPNAATGEGRKVGVEIELAGLSEAETARLTAEVLGGAAREAKPGAFTVTGGALGEIEVVLDTRFRDQIERAAPETGLALARAVIPVEIVTPPIPPADITRLDDLRDRLRRAGASGTRGGVLLGLGLHLNIEVPGMTAAEVRPILTAYALLEDALRGGRRVDMTRRLLPFTDPYPRAFVDALVERQDCDMDELIDLYLRETPSRDRGLDMLPLFAEIAPERVARATEGDPAIGARPAFHYRLPDCRIDEAGWSIALEWNRWVEIERIAGAPDVLRALCEAWRAHRTSWTTLRGDWATTAAGIVEDAAAAGRR